MATRMRIERLEHAVDRAVDESIRLHRLRVVGADGVERGGEGLVVIGQVLGCQCAPSEEHTAGHGRQENGKGRVQQTDAAHDRMLTD